MTTPPEFMPIYKERKLSYRNIPSSIQHKKFDLLYICAQFIPNDFDSAILWSLELLWMLDQLKLITFEIHSISKLLTSK